jgi:hypothetical protein
MHECPPVDPLTDLPERLSPTGLYADFVSDTLESDVVPFEPRFELWSDGAEKRPWLSLPPSGAIDASDEDT